MKSIRLFVVFGILAFGAIVAPVMAATDPGDGTTCTSDTSDGSGLPECFTPDDNECFPSGVLYREENQDGCKSDWYWKAGWFLARFNDGKISRADFPVEFESVLPPLVKVKKTLVGCSMPSGTSIQVTFDNQSSGSVDVYWLDFSCNLRFYRNLSAGSSYQQQTFVNHQWYVMDSNHQTLYCFKASTATTITITGTPQNYC